ncbi:homeobox-leucine zipper protein HOX11-like [Cucurbita moschata]|uniref:Homeobox-leucine zipper protein HOX11-like n=1 Tax=Cucurbita moschata TaxID=3662 RepID=A0A6J1EUG8_CUCMO|nr:homeobox-leucine zipper protein HOX11-like [Cucurbita moschata]
MELGLRLGDAPNSNNPFGVRSIPSSSSLMALGFCVGLGHGSGSGSGFGRVHDEDGRDVKDEDEDDDEKTIPGSGYGLGPPVQLDLLPLAPVPRSSHQSSSPLPFSCLSHPLMPELGCTDKVLDVNRPPALAAAVAMIPAEETEDQSPNSTVTSFQMDFGVRNGGGRGRTRSKRSSDMEMEKERSSSRMSDDEENASARKKLRLSKEQSAFLEQSFKQHSTLNPKQKAALAKQLNLRPRQVEVWFQNRRARTKLKQTEEDCEYLKRWCETLTEENRRLQKELQELRAFKASQPFYSHLPATTLTMCPSCERVVATAPAASIATTCTITAAPPRILI